jgi:hypothetical protein
MNSAEGALGRPGMVMISPQMTTRKPAPAESRTSRIGTTWSVGAPLRLGSVEKDYCVLATQIGRLPYPAASMSRNWSRTFWSAMMSEAR